MIFALFACVLTLQQGAPTTPIRPLDSHGLTRTHAARSQSKPAVGGVGKTRHRKRKTQHPAPKAQNPRPQVSYLDKPAGTGEPVKAGDLVTIHFLVKKRGGEDVADSKKRGLPYSFRIGEAGNDPLLDLVVKGMKVGAIRTQTVPARDAYGPGGAPPVISAKDTLIVTVTLLRRGPN